MLVPLLMLRLAAAALAAVYEQGSPMLLDSLCRETAGSNQKPHPQTPAE